MDLPGIEKLTQQYADERAVLSALVDELQGTLENVKRARLPKIKKAVAATAKSLAALQEAVGDAPDLFDKPKTQIFSGIRVGYRKGEGVLVIDDEDYTVKRIRKMFGDDAETYLSVTTRPRKEALKNLDAQELRKLGVEIDGGSDVVFIKETDGEAEKVVNALLKGAIKEATA